VESQNSQAVECSAKVMEHRGLTAKVWGYFLKFDEFCLI